MSTPPDHFSAQASDYRRHRPTYPNTLFDWLASVAPDRALAWDCACGSGQATEGLARHFDAVVGTDLSAQQIAQAPQVANVHYRIEPAEHSSFDDGTVALTLVAQALHWFDQDAFHAELRRVSKPGGVAVALTYNLLSISPEVDAVIRHLYHDVVGRHWPPGREHVESNYAHLPWPFPRIEAPAFAMRADWTLQHLLGYLRSWSATARYSAETGMDPITPATGALRDAWGAVETRTVHWPLTILAGRTG